MIAVLEQLRCHGEPLAITLEQTENDRLLEEKKPITRIYSPIKGNIDDSRKSVSYKTEEVNTVAPGNEKDYCQF